MQTAFLTVHGPRQNDMLGFPYLIINIETEHFTDMRIRTRSLAMLLLSTSIFTSGCISILSRKGAFEPELHTTGKIYPGLQNGVLIVGISTVQIFSSAAPFIVMLVPVVLADMPLSFAWDTICLPHDIADIGCKAKVTWHGSGTYWLVRTDREGRRHGKCVFQLSAKDATIWGYVNYEHGLRKGLAEAYGGRWEKGDIAGQYVDDKKWVGSFLLHADEINRLEVGPVVRYENGELLETLDIVLPIRE